jgi:hypothetical protein
MNRDVRGGLIVMAAGAAVGVAGWLVNDGRPVPQLAALRSDVARSTPSPQTPAPVPKRATVTAPALADEPVAKEQPAVEAPSPASSSPAGPSIRNVRAEAAGVHLRLTCPDHAAVGDVVEIQIEAVNAGGTALVDLAVRTSLETGAATFRDLPGSCRAQADWNPQANCRRDELAADDSFALGVPLEVTGPGQMRVNAGPLRVDGRPGHHARGFVRYPHRERSGSGPTPNRSDRKRNCAGAHAECDFELPVHSSVDACTGRRCNRPYGSPQAHPTRDGRRPPPPRRDV